MIFHVALDQNGKPSWWLYGANNELLAWAGRYYASLAFARKEASAFRAIASTATYEIHPHPDDSWSWRVIQPVDYYMAYSVPSFASSTAARRAARKVRKGAARASGL